MVKFAILFSYICNMKKRIHYYIYEDDKFMREVYNQIFDELPDIGAIEYIGSKSKSNSLSYKVDGCREKSKNKNIEDTETEKNLNLNIEHRAGGDIAFSESYGEDTIRFYANIDDVKQIVNSGMYSDIIEKIAKSGCPKYADFIHLEGTLTLYDNYEDGEDIFLKIDKYCIWLKRKYLDTNILTLIKILGEVNVIGFVVKGETSMTPAILKTIAIYT